MINNQSHNHKKYDFYRFNIIKNQRHKIIKYFKVFVLLICMLQMQQAYSQVLSVNYQLEYVDSSAHYNMNLIINSGFATSYLDRIQFNSQYTLIFPDSLNFNFVEFLMPLKDNSNTTGTVPTTYFEHASEDQLGYTYLALRPTISPICAYNNISAGDTIPLFIFDMGGYHQEVRLLENGVDNPPTSSDYLQGFIIGGFTQKYSANSPTKGIPEAPLFKVHSEYTSGNRSLHIGDKSGTPSTSAILELASTEKGFLPPRMTNQEIVALENVEEGLMVYSTTEHMPVYYTGIYWRKSDGQPLEVKIGSMAYGGVVINVSDAGEVLVLDTSLILNEVIGTWGCPGTNMPSTEALSGPYDLGKTNTATMLSNCNLPGTAAYIVSNLSVIQNGITYNDWHLASAQDFLQIKAFGFPLDSNFWIAHQYNSQDAVLEVNDLFGNLSTVTNPKSDQSNIYAVRTFILE